MTLPEFDKPPLLEVALSVDFEPISGLTHAHLGMLWKRYREKFPRVEEYPKLSSRQEVFGGVSKARDLQLQISQRPEMRFWFLNDIKTDLIQVQNNRFIRNWRKNDASQEYPRFFHVENSFFEEFLQFEKFLEDERLPSPIPTQCEITYVNQIYPDSLENGHDGMLGIFGSNMNLLSAESGLLFENTQQNWRYLVKNEAGKPFARLYINIDPGYVANRAITSLTLCLKGYPAEKTVNGIKGFFEKGHEIIVRTFTEVTSGEYHNEWRRKK